MQVQYSRPGQRRIERLVCRAVQRCLVVQQLPPLQPERSLPARQPLIVRWRRGVACVDRPPLLSEIYRDENQTFSSVNSAWIHSVVLITLHCYWYLLYIVFLKRETPYSWWCLYQILTDFHNSVTGWFPCKFAVKGLLKISARLAYVATLPCERLMSENKRLAINYKVVCGGVELKKVYCRICLRIFFF